MCPDTDCTPPAVLACTARSVFMVRLSYIVPHAYQHSSHNQIRLHPSLASCQSQEILSFIKSLQTCECSV